MSANYNYTHGATTNLNRLRLLIADHRGASGSFTGTNQLFSDEELDDILTLYSSDIPAAARMAIQVRLNREALAAGVAGTTDTSDRPKALIIALDGMARLPWPADGLPTSSTTSNADLDDTTDLGDTP